MIFCPWNDEGGRVGEWTGRLFSASPEKDGGRVVSGKLIIWSRERQLCGFGKGNYFSNADIYSIDV